ncbi:ABC transporter permease [Actinoplanes utahensis]|uniref:ABC transmembrane type-2 domain-containing protein n=1 Tax=Actinoplanes utahensis TaxID=1869 RepID=A0A0A6X053_ACTUT|nr:ABC transporter permease [Actinoplanes utahensis]KHD73382.1 hypothetical protein MB27_34705 [Actinoplanes utahensis]GIF30133.1 transport permease protein [Actinoplanes utahensis]
MKTELKHTARLARVDLTLIVRNRSALTNAVLMPLLVTAFLIFSVREQGGKEELDYMVTGQFAALLVYAPLVNLAGFYTSRREELVLKRLLGGPASALAILGGSALGAAVVYLVQALAVGVAAVALGVGLPTNPLLVLVAALGGLVLFSLLSMAVSGFSSSGELAQLATVPVMLLSLILSPVIVPLDALPEQLQRISEFLPMTPVAEVIRAGYLGDVVWSETLRSLAVLAVWVGVAAELARRYFRWDPRRG